MCIFCFFFLAWASTARTYSVSTDSNLSLAKTGPVTSHRAHTHTGGAAAQKPYICVFPATLQPTTSALLLNTPGRMWACTRTRRPADYSSLCVNLYGLHSQPKDSEGIWFGPVTPQHLLKCEHKLLWTQGSPAGSERKAACQGGLKLPGAKLLMLFLCHV